MLTTQLAVPDHGASSDASCLGRGTRAKRSPELLAQAKTGNQINLCILGKQKLQLPWR